MFIIYTNGNGKSESIILDWSNTAPLICIVEITVSPRVAVGNSEPSIDWSKNVTLAKGSSTDHGRYNARWDCENCRGRLNISDENQKMIYAVGPRDVDLDTSSLDAALRRHDWYGRFEINMTKAVGDPLKFADFWPTSSDDPHNVGYEVDDHDFATPIHGVFMAGTFVMLFPLGIIWLKIFEKVRLHWLTQAVGVLIVLIGAGIGILLSKQYNRVSKQSSRWQNRAYSCPTHLFCSRSIFLHPTRSLALSSCFSYYFKLVLERHTIHHSRATRSPQSYPVFTASLALSPYASVSSMARCKSL